MLQQIRSLLRQAPFRPFSIRCSSGDVFRVDHPENATVWRSFVLVALPGQPAGEDAIMLSALHIVGVTGGEQIAA